MKEVKEILYNLVFLVYPCELSDKIWWRQKEALCSAHLLVEHKLCITKTLQQVVF